MRSHMAQLAPTGKGSLLLSYALADMHPCRDGLSIRPAHNDEDSITRFCVEKKFSEPRKSPFPFPAQVIRFCWVVCRAQQADDEKRGLLFHMRASALPPIASAVGIKESSALYLAQSSAFVAGSVSSLESTHLTSWSAKMSNFCSLNEVRLGSKKLTISFSWLYYIVYISVTMCAWWTMYKSKFDIFKRKIA